MAAPFNNKNAEKWTLRKAIKLYHDALKLSSKEETMKVTKGSEVRTITGYKFDFIGEIATELGTYHELISRDLPNRFPCLVRLKNQLVRTLERNCYSNTKKGFIKEATGLVNLKSNHKWTDRIDNTSGGRPVNKEVTVVFKNYSKKKNQSEN